VSSSSPLPSLPWICRSSLEGFLSSCIGCGFGNWRIALGPSHYSKIGHSLPPNPLRQGTVDCSPFSGSLLDPSSPAYYRLSIIFLTLPYLRVVMLLEPNLPWGGPYESQFLAVCKLCSGFLQMSGVRSHSKALTVFYSLRHYSSLAFSSSPYPLTTLNEPQVGPSASFSVRGIWRAVREKCRDAIQCCIFNSCTLLCDACTFRPVCTESS